MSSQVPKSQIDITKAMTDELVTHSNVKQELIITTVDKLKLCLIEHKDLLRSRREWLGPTGVLLSILGTLVAAQFKDALGLPAPTWLAIYLIVAAVSTATAIVLGVRALMNIRKTGIDHLIDKIAARAQGGGLQVLSSAYTASMADLLQSLVSPPSKDKK